MGHAHAHSHHSHDHHGHAHGAEATSKSRILIAAVLTGGFMLAEAVGGVLTGSLALIADAGHMLTDSVALFFAWYAFHLAGRQATARLSFGYDRLKTLVAYTNGLAIFVIGGWIVWEAWQRFEQPSAVLGGPMLAIALIGLAVNIGAFLVLHGGDRQDLNMRGALLHVIGDLLGSVAALAAAGVILATGWYPIDPILSVLVALLLFRSAYGLVRDAGHVLLEGSPVGIDRDGVARDLVASVAQLRDVHHMHVWSLDGTRNVATLHARLVPGADPHAAIGAIKRRLATTHGIGHATVEPEFDCCADSHHEEHGHERPDDPNVGHRHLH
ncbi:cation diffusion facilitator family transporter [Aquibium sp. ELW1220]|uniref:cation diffusion facilitator family transporter n=1 Tax=Aquibium sp. ELW1220 TaxID=2976766 RepID=UPI0025B2237B|nr:cation diffusion facilitator family transporter [Aquibium sp. ELW1220]MDN2580555.1 cation diffusion facilitator family transporter [Aquibium sp. ELW1220]